MNRKLFLVTFLMLLYSTMFGQNNWKYTVNSDNDSYATYFTINAVIQYDGEEQNSDKLELAAFYGDECRATAKTEIVFNDRNIVKLRVYGENGQSFTLKLYDHSTGKEYTDNYVIRYEDGAIDDLEISYVADMRYGSIANPAVINFKTPNYYTPDTSGDEGNMSLTAVVLIDGVEEHDSNLEVGAFCGNICKGSAKANLVDTNNGVTRNYAKMVIGGSANDVITFKLYNHETKEELFTYDVTTINYQAGDDASIGTILDPFVVNFITKPYIAKIDDTKYTSLKDAFAAVGEGETIELIKDNGTGIIEEGTVKLPATLRDVTLKGAEGVVLKDMTIMSADGNSVNYEGLTFDGVTFDNSNIVFTGMRNGLVNYKDIVITNCIFKNIERTGNYAAFHFNSNSSEAMNGFTFTNNRIDGVTGSSNSGINLKYCTGEIKVQNNIINNVAFRPYLIQVVTNDGIADNFVSTKNTFSGSASGRLQVLANVTDGTDAVNLVVNNNIFKGITETQQFCYYNFNPEKTTADFSKNYYDIDILANPSKIYYNSAAQNAKDLIEIGVYPYYADEAMTTLVYAPSIMVTYPIGNPVYPEGKVEYYENMLDAVPYTTNCPRLEGATITLLKNVSGKGLRFMENDMVFDLNGHTYTIEEATGSQGTNTSGFQIRPEVTTNVIFKNGKIQVSEGTHVVWMFNCYATDFIVENVTVDCSNMAWSYGEQCYVVVSRDGDNVQFTGTTKVENFNSTVAGNAYDVGGTMTIGDNVTPGGTINLSVGATLTAREGLDVVVTEENYGVVYNDGVYSTIKYFAKIGDVYYATLAEAFAAAQNGDEVVVLQSGTYALSTSGKNITITGKVSGVVFENIGAKNMGGANVTFNNVTFTYAENSTYKGLQHSGNLVYNNCTFNGQVFLYGNKETFNNCTFNTTDSNNYNVWTYGAKDVAFNGCTFNSAGKSVLIYAEDATLINYVTVTACTFNASTAVDGKAAIEMDSSLTAGINLTIDGETTATGFGSGNVSGNSLWNNKKGNATAANNDITVVVDGVTVLAPVFEAQIGDKKYRSIQEAINAAENGAIVNVIKDHELIAQNAQEYFKPAYNRESYCGIVIPDDKAIVLNLNGFTVSYVDRYVDVDNVMILNLGNLTINDTEGGKLTYKPVAGTTTYSKFYSTIFNCGTLTVNGGTIENTAEAETDVTNAVDNHSRLSHEYGNDCILTVNGGTLSGAYYYAIRQYTHYLEGVQNRVTINDGDINGGIYMQHGDSWYYANPESKRLNVDCYLTINGGNINIDTTPDEFGKIKSRLSNPDNNAFGLEINGGNINVPVELLVQRGVYYTNGVSGATTPAEPAGTRNAEWLAKNGGFVKGGVYKELGVEGTTTDLKSFLAAGHQLKDNGNGTYSIVKGTLSAAYTTTYGYFGECGGNANDSFEFKFYNDDTYMGSTSLNDVGNIIDGDVYVTWNMKLDATSNTDEYWTMSWDVAPTIAMQPNRVEQWIDGVKVTECTIQPNGPDNLNPIVAAVAAGENRVIKSYATSLTNAVAAAEGNTVVLFRDINETLTVVKPTNNINIDGNNKTVKGGMSFGSDDNKLDNYSITVSNVNFEGKGISVNELTSVAIKDNKFTGITVGNAITVVCDGLTQNVNVSGNTVNDVEAGHGIRIRNAVAAVVDKNNIDGVFNSAILLEGTTTGNVAVTNNVLNDWGKDAVNKGRAIRIVKGADTTATITGNAMMHENAPEEFVKVTGNTENININENYWNGYNPDETAGLYDVLNVYPENYYSEYVNGELKNLVTLSYVAQIGAAKYTTLQKAINAAKANDIVKIISNIEYENYVYAAGKTTAVNIAKGKDFTLDLNGHTVSGTNNTEKNYEFITVESGAKLTIVDNSSEGNGKISYTGTRETADGWMNRCHTILNRGTLVVNGGTIENNTPVEAEAVASAIDNNASWGYLGSMIINGGTVKSASYYAIRTDVNTHNTTAAGTNVSTTQFNGGTVYGFYLMDRGSDLPNAKPNTIDFNVGDDATIKPCAYNGQALRFRVNAKSTYDIEVSEEAEVEGTIIGVVAKSANKYYVKLQDALNAIQEDATITFLSDITENVTVDQNNGIDIVIDGNNKNFSGTITIDGNSRTYGESLTIQNINFVTDVEGLYFIEQNSAEGDVRYPHNVTVQRCTFTAKENSPAVNTAVAMRFRQGFNITVKDVESVGLHSLMQNYGVAGVTVENVEVDGKNGISLGTSTNVTIQGANITATGYGLRFDAETTTSAVVTDCEINAFIPVVVRYATKDYNITFNGDNTMDQTNTDGYWCVIGTSEYEANGQLPTAATGKVIVALNDDNLSMTGVYGNYYEATINGTQYIALKDAFEAAEEDNEIVVARDINLTETINVVAGQNITLNLAGYTVSMTDSSNAASALIKTYGNLTIKGEEGSKLSFVTTAPSAANAYASNTISNYGTITVLSGIIENTTVGGACYALDNYAGSTATIKGGKLIAEKTTLRVFNWTDGEAAKATLNIQGGEIVSNDGYGVNLNLGNKPCVDLKITGGTITTNDTDYNLAVYVVNKNSAENVNINVEGGIFNGNFALNGLTATTMVEGKVSISGGTFEGVICYATPAYGFITGGAFGMDVNEYCHEYYDAIEYEEGIWTVEQVLYAQTTSLNRGWNWHSSYINLSSEAGLVELQEALDGKGIEIKGKTGFSDYQYIGEIDGVAQYKWYKTDDFIISAKQMYMIKTTEAVEIMVDGKIVDPATTPITLRPGWNWIGYPVAENLSINVALAGLEAEEGDVIKSRDGESEYIEGYGWDGELLTMEPGEGYMYYSQVRKTFTYSMNTRREKYSNENVTADNNHWVPEVSQYANNMSIVAMMNKEGETMKDNYELAAFANGECRGSARPVYIEALDSYVVFMTVFGEEAEELTFKYYDINNETESELKDVLTYSSDTRIGSARNPYMFYMNTLNIEESTLDMINIYPNPTTTDRAINLQATCDNVEVFNALGVKVAEYQNVDTIDALETAGVYVIRVTINGETRNCRLVVK